MIKARQKEESDSIFTLDELFQESIEMNNFIKKKIESPISTSFSQNKFFSKKIKLHNCSKKNFWERNICPSNLSSYSINIFDVIKDFQISNKLLGSIQEYIFNDIKDLFIGKLNSSKENSNYFDIIDSPSAKEKDCNLIMIPKLMINKNNKKNNFNELFEVAYQKLRKISENKNYEFYHQIFYFYRKNKSNNLATKIYTIFPNVNFEFRQIKNLSFSNTNLNKFLTSSKYQIQENNNINSSNNNNNKYDETYLSGFFTMSQNHRLIALKDDIKESGNISKSQSLKEIIFGIWINLKEEKPNSNNKIDLDILFNKNKYLIYKQCFRFIELSQHIETIYSPSPEENIFILVLFYKGIQCHYEVKLNFNLDSNLNQKNKNNNNNNNKNDILNTNNNSWLISKCKYELDEQAMKVPFDYDIKIEINNGDILSMNDFLNKKLINKQTQQQKNNENKKENLINSKNEKTKENISDIFYLSDFNGDSMNNEYKNKFNLNNLNTHANSVNNNLINININNQNNKNEHDQICINKKSQISHISHASTNAHSKKPSLSLSKNSKNNKEVNNMEQIYTSFNKEVKDDKEDKDEINIGSNNFTESLSQYTSIIKRNSENIKKLENQVNKMEMEIKEIIKNLEEEDNNEEMKKNKKNEKIEKNENNNDISGIGDISINVPKIICKDLSMTNDI